MTTVKVNQSLDNYEHNYDDPLQVCAFLVRFQLIMVDSTALNLPPLLL